MAHEVPPLPYEYNSLEPHVDEQTMRIHHDKHHGAYVTKLNAAIEGTEFESWSVSKLMTDINQIPADKRTAVQNNGGGHANHSLFWKTMSPDGGGDPTGALSDAIKQTYGEFSSFQDSFSKASMSRFGSGWAWLAVKFGGTLVMYTTPNQDSPYSFTGDIPLLGLDLWEHAYYLNYQNLRGDYITAFFNVVNWAEVSKRYSESL